MSRGKYKFKQSDIVRAVKAVRAAGSSGIVEFTSEGTLRIIVNADDAPIKQTNSVNEWDGVQ